MTRKKRIRFIDNTRQKLARPENRRDGRIDRYGIAGKCDRKNNRLDFLRQFRGSGGRDGNRYRSGCRKHDVTAAVKGGKSAVCEIAVSSGEPVAGDYYHSDGTYSAELDAAKKVIGVVFWVGDPTASDAALKREHPGCTHGLVVAVNEVVTP